MPLVGSKKKPIADASRSLVISILRHTRNRQDCRCGINVSGRSHDVLGEGLVHKGVGPRKGLFEPLVAADEGIVVVVGGPITRPANYGYCTARVMRIPHLFSAVSAVGFDVMGRPHPKSEYSLQ